MPRDEFDELDDKFRRSWQARAMLLESEVRQQRADFEEAQRKLIEVIRLQHGVMNASLIEIVRRIDLIGSRSSSTAPMTEKEYRSRREELEREYDARRDDSFRGYRFASDPPSFGLKSINTSC